MKTMVIRLNLRKALFCSAGMVILFMAGMTCFAQTKTISPQGKEIQASPVDYPKSLGSVWQVNECCGWTGTWTLRPGTVLFDCRWKHTNGTVVTDVVEFKSMNLSNNEVVVWRKSMNGYYKATFVPASKTLINGTTTWYAAGQTWSATVR